MNDNLFGKTLAEIELICQSLDIPKYTGQQICNWMYHKNVYNLEKMTNISKKIQKKILKNYKLYLSPPYKKLISKDGTKKYVFQTQNGFIETAVIISNDRVTLCLSTQVGCKRKCSFCLTGKQKFQGNLSIEEILNQYAFSAKQNNITNIVYMGMGEPFDNLDNVMKSLEILTAKYGYGKSSKRITVSTVGIIDAVEHFLKYSKCNLAISLHSPFSNERKKLMPVEKLYPFEKLLTILKGYTLSKQQRITFEYTLFKGLNDTIAHANKLCQVLAGLRGRINLLSFNEFPGSTLQSTCQENTLKFKAILEKKGFIATIRKSKGTDISAACGLLSTKEIMNHRH